MCKYCNLCPIKLLRLTKLWGPWLNDINAEYDVPLYLTVFVLLWWHEWEVIGSAALGQSVLSTPKMKWTQVVEAHWRNLGLFYLMTEVGSNDELHLLWVNVTFTWVDLWSGDTALTQLDYGRPVTFVFTIYLTRSTLYFCQRDATVIGYNGTRGCLHPPLGGFRGVSSHCIKACNEKRQSLS